MSAAFLRELAEIIHYVPYVQSGLTELHVEALRDTANAIEADEQRARESDRTSLRLMGERDRAIYNLLSLLHAPCDEDRTAREQAVSCLQWLGYWPDGDRAGRMLKLGEPGKDAAPSRRDFSCIPPLVLEGLKRYGEHGTPVGEFLQAVIANDFRDAACRADDDSARALTAIAIYVYQEMPSKCHGSREKYKAWLRQHEDSL